jgi:cation diffusion facilitator family transporter
MGWKSIERFINPVEIHFNIAITVAVIGLVVNGASMLILGEHGHSHDHGGHDHGGQDHHNHHDHAEHDHHDHAEHSHSKSSSDSDHNLKAAYLHVLTDALTSVFAIFALLAAKYFGWIWADPLMGVVGAILVARWSFGLIKNAGQVLLDNQMSQDIREKVAGILESYKDTRVTDLHLWAIGPGIYSANLSVVTQYPDPPDKYKSMIPSNLGIVHTTVEVHQCEN